MDSGYYDDYQLQEGPEEALHVDALAASEEAALLKGRAFSNKVPPIFKGDSSWFAYEDAIDEWCSITLTTRL